ncbi:hypothetical protein ACQ4PT_045599 [Festuca glaucescens]
MHGNRAAGVLVLLAALLLAASASPDVGAYGGRVVISHAAAEGTRASARIHTASATLTRQLEDEVARELSWAAGLLKGISTGALNPNRPACPKNGPCSGRGEPYTGRDCKAIFDCRSVPP